MNELELKFKSETGKQAKVYVDGDIVFISEEVYGVDRGECFVYSLEYVKWLEEMV